MGDERVRDLDEIREFANAAWAADSAPPDLLEDVVDLCAEVERLSAFEGLWVKAERAYLAAAAEVERLRADQTRYLTAVGAVVETGYAGDVSPADAIWSLVEEREVLRVAVSERDDLLRALDDGEPHVARHWDSAVWCAACGVEYPCPVARARAALASGVIEGDKKHG